ncbi:MAG: hypothetical protein ABIQ93_16130 [Saprospiraceae bacterium]
MKNKILLFTSLLAGCILFLVACHKTEANDSVAKQASVPYLAYSLLEDVYIYGEGSSTLFADLPNVVGVLVDTVYGFEGGYGGRTGMDSIKVLKSDLVFGDTISVGGSGFSTFKYSKGNYRTSIGSSVVIASANDNPGPTALEGNYKRTTAAGYILVLSKVADGIYLLTNPGGAASVSPNPYLLYNFKNSAGGDSLSFANQTDLCGGGVQLVDPGAPLSLSSAEYSEKYPPKLIPPNPFATPPTPLTLTWRVLEFPTADSGAVNPGGALCNWGTGVRTFEKQ